MRLRGRLGRYGFDVKSYDIGEARGDRGLRARLPGERGGAVAAAARARRAPRSPRTRATCSTRCRPSSSCRSARDALWALHLPRTLDEAEEARRRLAFDELLALQLAVARSRDEDASRGPALGDRRASSSRATAAALPFELTEHQERAIAEIDGDLARDRADAAAAPGRRRLGQDGRRALRAAARGRGGRQGALMAPTETLAEQHFLTRRDALPRARRARACC